MIAHVALIPLTQPLPTGISFPYQGVKLARYNEARFVVMNLRPLSDEQQRVAIAQQLDGSADFDHLSAFAAIRREHDKIYAKAFPDDDMRRAVESFEHPDKFKLPSGAKDPQMRQRTKDGTRFVCMSRQAEPQSDYLRSRRPFFSPAVLDELGSLLAPLPSDATKEAVQAVVARLTKAPGVTRLREQYDENIFAREDAEPEVKEQLKGESDFSCMGLAVKLGLLLLKCQATESTLTAAALWERVWRRTDDVFLATEDLLDPFKRALELLVEALGGGIELRFGELKVASAHTPTFARQSCAPDQPSQRLRLAAGSCPHPRERMRRVRERPQRLGRRQGH